MKFIHVTDTHLVAPGRMLCALDPGARLSAVIDDVIRVHADADLMVLTGDLSYHGLEPAYELLREILSKLCIPCYLRIGNHDDRETFKRSFPSTPTDPNGFIQYAVETTVGAFVMLDTVEHSKEEGLMCRSRLDWLAGTLEDFADQPVFIFMHHPPFDVGVASLDASKMQGDGELARLLKQHGNVRHLFYGHVHRAIAGSWHGIPATTLPGTNHQVALYLGQETQMFGSHERPAYGICFADDTSVVIHYKDFTDSSPRFVLTDPRSKDAREPAQLIPAPPRFDGLL